MNIPLTKPFTDEAEVEAVRQVLASGWLTQGPKVKEFEEAVRKFVGTDYAVACTSCTTALHMGLLALGIGGKNNTVLVPAFTWVATANAVEYVRARPLFVDIDLRTFNIDCVDALRRIEGLPEKQKASVKAIIPVHLFGLCADVNEVHALSLGYKLSVLEDAACALGSQYSGRFAGNLGSEASCLSFHPRKSVTTGEGGMLLTNDRLIADHCRSLRDFGFDETKRIKILGYNYKMSDLQSTVGVEQVKKLPTIIEARRRRAHIYDSELGGLDWLQIPSEPTGYRHTYQSYVTLIGDLRGKLTADKIDQAGVLQKRVAAHLANNEIATRFGTQAVHALDYYRRKYRIKPMDFPNAWVAQQCSLTLPLYSQMTDAEQEYVIQKVKEFKP